MLQLNNHQLKIYITDVTKKDVSTTLLITNMQTACARLRATSKPA